MSLCNFVQVHVIPSESTWVHVIRCKSMWVHPSPYWGSKHCVTTHFPSGLLQSLDLIKGGFMTHLCIDPVTVHATSQHSFLYDGQTKQYEKIETLTQFQYVGLIRRHSIYELWLIRRYTSGFPAGRGCVTHVLRPKSQELGTSLLLRLFYRITIMFGRIASI